jgi:hypothetical protein
VRAGMIGINTERYYRDKRNSALLLISRLETD